MKNDVVIRNEELLLLALCRLEFNGGINGF